MLARSSAALSPAPQLPDAAQPSSGPVSPSLWPARLPAFPSLGPAERCLLKGSPDGQSRGRPAGPWAVRHSLPPARPSVSPRPGALSPRAALCTGRVLREEEAKEGARLPVFPPDVPSSRLTPTHLRSARPLLLRAPSARLSRSCRTGVPREQGSAQRPRPARPADTERLVPPAGDGIQGGRAGVPGAAAVRQSAQAALLPGRRLVLQLDLRAGPRGRRGRIQVPVLPLGGGQWRPEPPGGHR